MTSRAWWCLVVFVMMLLVGILRDINGLVLTGLTLLTWFAWEWLFFLLRAHLYLRNLRVERDVADERGPAKTLWQGREYTVFVELHLDGKGRFPYVAVADPVPFGVRHEEGKTTGDGALQAGEPITLEYHVQCPQAGVARFEGVRVEVTDLQGFFARVVFVRAPVVLPILPKVLVRHGGGPTVKVSNELMPPGIHRLKQPGSGSELLDLRDYVPGDPPRTIAWKVSARRDRLVTKEFESEVPIRCTLFLDVSSSVRVPSPPKPEAQAEDLIHARPLDRLIELAVGVLHASGTIRDLTGLCLFDEHGVRVVRAERGRNQQTKLRQVLGEAAALGPVVSRADPQALLAVAYGLAQEVYPDLLRAEVNSTPAFMVWFAGLGRYTRHWRGWLEAVYRSKRTVLLWGTTVIPLGVLITNLVAALFDEVPDRARTLLGGLLYFGVPAVVTGAWVVFLLSIAGGHNQRRLARWRKRLAALFCARAALSPSTAKHDGPAPLAVPGAVDALLEDDDLFSLHLQHFLTEHQVPCAAPLYDANGRYLYSCPEKVGVLARALLHAVHRGRDNELFVLLADLIELDAQLDPLLSAVRVALGRHHQVMLVCPWPRDVPLPRAEPTGSSPAEPTAPLPQWTHALTTDRLHSAFARIRRAFVRLGVPVICASSDESLPLILTRIERLRGARRLPGGRS